MSNNHLLSDGKFEWVPSIVDEAQPRDMALVIVAKTKMFKGYCYMTLDEEDRFLRPIYRTQVNGCCWSRENNMELWNQYRFGVLRYPAIDVEIENETNIQEAEDKIMAEEVLPNIETKLQNFRTKMEPAHEDVDMNSQSKGLENSKLEIQLILTACSDYKMGHLTTFLDAEPRTKASILDSEVAEVLSNGNQSTLTTFPHRTEDLLVKEEVEYVGEVEKSRLYSRLLNKAFFRIEEIFETLKEDGKYWYVEEGTLCPSFGVLRTNSSSLRVREFMKEDKLKYELKISLPGATRDYYLPITALEFDKPNLCNDYDEDHTEISEDNNETTAVENGDNSDAIVILGLSRAYLRFNPKACILLVINIMTNRS